ncbi:hypothetical protein FACS1894139_17550 [Planctomycetales bacterium]|nr:hypothetical protein FACS1894107_12900 [Planctomycetales bacterium]GHT08187.1 hypothetical protein FACS1894139_17550 [Planctomycetales bacterium]GHV18718.1 hypothetical protein AGMMS49959_01260 [Planctomycetales bacterium]
MSDYNDNNYDFLTVAVAHKLLTREQVDGVRRTMQTQIAMGQTPHKPEEILRHEDILTETQIWAIGKARERLLRDYENHAHKIGNYEIIETVGEGGLGIVYKAKQISIGRLVALKVLHEKWMSDAEFRNRFLVEARLVGRLSHPNLIQVIDVGRHQNQLYYSMEFVDGETVEKMIFRRGRLELSEAIAIIAQTAGALQYLAEKKIVHRDVKPSNIIVTKKGVAKLGDFGFVKSSLESVIWTVGAVTPGEVLGTPDYISPEAANGEKNLDFRSDIYSLGATFYHMVSGQTPFNGTCSAVLASHIAEPPPPLNEVNAQAPRELTRMLNKMMSKDPQDRYQSYDELFAALEKLRRRRAPAAPAFGDGDAWRWRDDARKWRNIAYIAGGLLALSWLFFALT